MLYRKLGFLRYCTARQLMIVSDSPAAYSAAGQGPSRAPQRRATRGKYL